jgi:hypothetical protein
MAESDRLRLMERALALPTASPADFAGGRRPPGDARPEHLKRINDTALRTKLVETHIAEGLQSPKGPQKIASIVRIYPSFDAPPKGASNGRKASRPAANTPGRRGLPTVEEMERLIARIREVERDVAGELAQRVDQQIAALKRTIADSSGEELERAHRELGTALAERRELAARVRGEAFRRVESDGNFSSRVHLRLLASG